MKTNKHTFLENRLVFQNAPETKPQDFESELSPQTPEGKLDDLNRQIQETRDSFQDFEKMSENEAAEAYDKLQDLSEKVRMLRGEIERKGDTKLLTRLNELDSYMKDLLDQLYIVGKDEHGFNVAVIGDLAEIVRSKDVYPDSDWLSNFDSLEYENQRKVIDKIIDDIDNPTAGTLIISENAEQFWRSFAVEHERQRKNSKYDWEAFVSKFKSAEKANGITLQFADKSLMKDKEVVMAAVENSDEINDLSRLALKDSNVLSKPEFTGVNYPDRTWCNRFADLSYSDQKEVVGRIINDIDNMTAGTLIVSDAAGKFWRSFAAQHQKQKNNPKYDWNKFIYQFIAVELEKKDKEQKVTEKELMNTKSEKADNAWLDKFAALNADRQKNVATALFNKKESSDYWKGFYSGCALVEMDSTGDLFDKGYYDAMEIAIA